MQDNTENPESFGERIPGAIEATTTEVDQQYEAYILLSVQEANESIMKTPEEQAEIGALEGELQVALGGTAAEVATEMSPEAQKTQERIALSESLEGKKFAFPGVSERYAATLRTEREEMAAFFDVTPWDELMQKFQSQGMKVYIGKNGETHILPGDTVDAEKGVDADSIMPRHLEISDDMDEGLKELIRKNQQ